MTKKLGWARVQIRDNAPLDSLRGWNAYLKEGNGTLGPHHLGGDKAFERDAGAAFTIRVEWIQINDTTTATAPTFGVQNTIKIALFYENDAAVIREITLSTVAANGDDGATFAFFATSDGTNGGVPRAGIYRVRLKVERTDTTTWGPIDSDGGDTSPPFATNRSREKGALRWGVKLNSFSIHNATFGGSPQPDPFAYPDKLRTRLNVDSGPHAASNVNTKLRYSYRQGGVEKAALVSAVVPAAGGNVDLDVNGDPGVTQNTFLAGLNATDFRVEVDGDGTFLPDSGAIRWVHFQTAFPAGFVGGDAQPAPGGGFRNATKANAANLNPDGSVENIFCDVENEYTEDGAGVPTGFENSLYAQLDENMMVKSGRVLNARSEALAGIFVFTEVKHIGTAQVRDSWGLDSLTFDTDANGWQGSRRVVGVVTPPAGLHSVKVEAYSPTGTKDAPATRKFYATRTETGTQRGIDAAKEWTELLQHTHNGTDSPRVSFKDLLDLPGGGVEFRPTVIVVDDGASQSQDRLRELPVVERGFGDATVSESRATSILLEKSPVEKRVSFTAELPTEPKLGDRVEIRDQGVTLIVREAKPLDATRWRLICGTLENFLVQQRQRELRRLEALERYT